MIKIIPIDNILNGWSTSDYISRQGKFLSSVAIDPDLPAYDDGNKPCGYIRPTVMNKFSGTNIDAVPLWLLTNPKDNKIYAILNNGKFISYTNDYTTETLINTLTACSGNGANYYDNAIYIATNTDIAKYSPLDNSPTMDTTYWTSTLSKTALTDINYPSINGVEMPNHVMHKHTDNKLYVCDVIDNKGYLHYIKTSKTTNEGDTDNGSTFGALDFNYGEYPTCIETYETDLVVGLIEGIDTTTKQKPAKISFWDTTSDSYSSITSVELSDPLITAIKNVNGTLYVFSGSANKGCRVSVLVSGYKLEEIAYLPEVYPPLPGAVDHILNRISWGSATVEPMIAPAIFSFGAKEAEIPMGLHCTDRASGNGTNPMITAILYATQTSFIIPPLIAGWKDDTSFGIDKKATGGGNSIWRSDVFTVDERFIIDRIRIPFVQGIDENMTLTVKIYKDGATNTPNANDNTLKIINNTNYIENEKFIEIKPNIRCDNNFFLQLEWSGTALLTVALPITIKIKID